MKQLEAGEEQRTRIRYGWWNEVYQIKVELVETEPAIWRRLLVPAGVKLPRLHDILQVAMGWTNSHLHEFLVGELHFGEPGEDFNVPPIDYAAIQLIQLAPRVGSAIRYLYDFGDHWEHLITVEDALPPESIAEPLPRCLDGARACPPEDVGGTHRYEEFLIALANPYHPEHKQWRRWAGLRFDPAAFDLDRVNRRLARFVPRRPRGTASTSGR
jgi:hypothetical protein